MERIFELIIDTGHEWNEAPWRVVSDAGDVLGSGATPLDAIEDASEAIEENIQAAMESGC